MADRHLENQWRVDAGDSFSTFLTLRESEGRASAAPPPTLLPVSYTHLHTTVGMLGGSSGVFVPIKGICSYKEEQNPVTAWQGLIVHLSWYQGE